MNLFRSSVIAGALALLLTAPTAHAVAVEDDVEYEPPVVVEANPEAEVSASAVRITCNTQASKPHASNHEPGKVNALTKMDCTAPVAQIIMDMQLYRNGQALVDHPPVANAGSSTNGINYATRCQTNSFYTAVTTYTIFWPPGFKPAASDGRVEYSAIVHCYQLRPGDRLNGNMELRSANQSARQRFVMQSDGNLVMYTPTGVAVWTSCTQGNPGAFAVMQTDGNLVVYSASGVPLFQTGTYGHPGAYFWLQKDGNGVIYTSGNPTVPLWDTRSRPTRC